MNNTIRLLKGYECLTKKDYKNFEKGDTICGLNREPEELKRCPVDQKEEALKELAMYRCKYRKLAELVEITEFALEFFEADEDGDFVSGSDFELAKEIEN